MLRVKNWEKYQHYKNRNPPWIKVSTKTFQDPKFSRLQDASKLLALCVWTLASQSKDGSIPEDFDFDYIVKWGMLGKTVKQEHMQELINKGFLIDDSALLASCAQVAAPEGENREQRTESEKESSPSILVVPDSVEVQEFDCSKVRLISTDIGAQASFAAGYVVDRLEWTGRDARLCYEAQIIKQLKKNDGRTAEAIAEEMVESWRLYRIASQGFRIKYGISNFFQKGIWCDGNQWAESDGSDSGRVSKKVQQGRAGYQEFLETEEKANCGVDYGDR